MSVRQIRKFDVPSCTAWVLMWKKKGILNSKSLQAFDVVVIY